MHSHCSVLAVVVVVVVVVVVIVAFTILKLSCTYATHGFDKDVPVPW